MSDLLRNKKMTRNCFSVPENYFERFHERILGASFRNYKKAKPVYKLRSYQRHLSIAAVLIVVFISSWYLAYQYQIDKNQMLNDYVIEYSENDFDVFLDFEDSEDYKYNEEMVDEVNYVFIAGVLH